MVCFPSIEYLCTYARMYVCTVHTFLLTDIKVKAAAEQQHKKVK